MINTNNHNYIKPTSTCIDSSIPPAKTKKLDFDNMSTEEIYNLLESRHGGGFAQWYIDQLTQKKT